MQVPFAKHLSSSVSNGPVQFSIQIEFEEKKKSEGKKARDDKDKVMDMLFAAFEKHQYYNIKDLVKITRQPIVTHLTSKFNNNASNIHYLQF